MSGSSSTATFGKVLFVISSIASTPFSRFQSLLYLDRGLTPSQIGTLSLTSPIKAAGYVLWGVLADNIGIKKALLFSIIISTLAMEPLRWRSTYTVFTWVLLAKGVRTATNAAWPLVDSFAAKSGGLKGYGSIRLWGSLSFGLSGLVVGGTLDYFFATMGFDSIFFISYALGGVLIILLLRFYPNDAPQNLEKSVSLSELMEILGSKQLFAFLLSSLLFGISVSVSSQVMPIWVKTELNGSATFLGALSVASVSLGLVVFAYSSWLLENIGARKMLLIAHVGHALRIAGYLWCDKSNFRWLLPVIETLHCFTFATYWMAATAVLVGICADTILSASQSLLATFHVTLGQLLGSFLLLNAFQTFGINGAVVGGLSAAIVSLIFAMAVVPNSNKKIPVY